MKQTLEFAGAVVIVILMISLFWRLIDPTNTPDEVLVPDPEPATMMSAEFRFVLEEAVRIELGAPIEGYEPAMLMQVFPGLEETDFDDVEATIGSYQYEAGALRHVYDPTEPMHSAGPALTELGFEILLENVVARLGNNAAEGTVDQIVIELQAGSDDPAQPVACTMDAKMCPDGSYVGRVGPNCEFAPCPGSEFPIRYGEDVSRMEVYRSDCEQRMGVFNECGSACGPEAETCMAVCSMICEGPADEHMPPVPPDSTFCTPASRNVDACIEIYQPVCGQVQVECIIEPCEPAPQDFSNSCFACMNDRVVSYTDGVCSEL